MQALEGEKSDNPLVVGLLRKLSALSERADIVFCWLPSHIGIAGNEKADKAAKDALLIEVLPFKVPFSDFKPLINSFIHVVWQRSWNDPSNQENKLFAIKPNISEWLPGSQSNRREEVVLARLRIGHTHMTHSYLLKGEEFPECIPCNTTLSVKHLLIECTDRAHYRDKYFHADGLKTLFDTEKLESLFDFLKEVNLFKRIKFYLFDVSPFTNGLKPRLSSFIGVLIASITILSK